MTFGIMIFDFQVEDKGGRPRFFQKTFLVANTKFEIILKMSFLKTSNANMAFGKKTLKWKLYTTNKALLTTKQIQLVNPKEFVITALDADSETFVVHIDLWKWEKMVIDPVKKAQIKV